MMITKITCRYSYEVLDFNFGFTFNIGVPYLGIIRRNQCIYVLIIYKCPNLLLAFELYFPRRVKGELINEAKNVQIFLNAEKTERRKRVLQC